MKLNPYLTFNGNCHEAMLFYKSCLGGDFEALETYDNGPFEVSDSYKSKIMHTTLNFDGNLLMASDSMENQPVRFGQNITINISFDSLNKIEEVFNKLSVKGKITMPLQDTFWGSRFGMLTDKYYVNWMFNHNLKK